MGRKSGRSLTDEEREALGQIRMTLRMSASDGRRLDKLAKRRDLSRAATIVELIRAAEK